LPKELDAWEAVVLSRLGLTRETATEILGEAGTREPVQAAGASRFGRLADRCAGGATMAAGLTVSVMKHPPQPFLLTAARSSSTPALSVSLTDPERR
jgi:hypothetical protein